MGPDNGDVVDSTADVPAGRVEKLGLYIVPIHISIDGQDFLHGVNLTNEEVIAAMQEEREVKTVPPIPSEYADLFEALLQQYARLLGLHVSSALSHCYTAAQRALQVMFEDEARRVQCMDTRTCTTGQAQTLTALLEEIIPAALGRIQLAAVGPTSTAHAGPGCICLSVVPT